MKENKSFSAFQFKTGKLADLTLKRLGITLEEARAKFGKKTSVLDRLVKKGNDNRTTTNQSG